MCIRVGRTNMKGINIEFGMGIALSRRRSWGVLRGQAERGRYPGHRCAAFGAAFLLLLYIPYADCTCKTAIISTYYPLRLTGRRVYPMQIGSWNIVLAEWVWLAPGDSSGRTLLSPTAAQLMRRNYRLETNRLRGR